MKKGCFILKSGLVQRLIEMGVCCECRLMTFEIFVGLNFFYLDNSRFVLEFQFSHESTVSEYN